MALQIEETFEGHEEDGSNYLQNYSRRKLLDFAAVILALGVIGAWAGLPKDEKTRYNEERMSALYTNNEALMKSLDSCKSAPPPSFGSGMYYYHEVTGKSESIPVKDMNVDLLILRNVFQERFLYFKIKNLKLGDIAYSPIPGNDTLAWSGDGPVPRHRLIIISIDKLKKLNSNVTIELEKSSMKEQPLVGRIELIVK